VDKSTIVQAFQRAFNAVRGACVERSVCVWGGGGGGWLLSMWAAVSLCILCRCVAVEPGVCLRCC
jgi:hypothetical protein